jgi:hypothetical protein
MSKLLKSKFLLGVIAVAVMFVGVVAVNAKTASAEACSTGTVTLRVGSRGPTVVCLQAALDSGIVADGIFGPKTKARVVAWQTANGLVADGLFGAKSRAVLVAGGSASTGLPAGCTSTTGYSSTTGVACNSGGTVTTTLPAGCTSTSGYSPTTGANCATGAVVTSTGPISAVLAADNPVSGSFIAPASGVQFAKFTFSGAGSVTSVKLQRTGVSASTTVTNVYLYDGATRLTDGASIGSDNTVTFNAPNGIFTVNGSRTITVVADTLAADYSLGFTLIGYTANGTASVVSLAGNQMYGAAATLAKATLSAALGSGATDAGLDITVWQATASIDLRDVLLKSIALRQIGNIASADIGNFKLYVDGVLTATVPTLDSNGYVTFATSTVLKTGSRIIKVTADIIGGASRTVQFSLRGAYDFQTTDTQYNANGITSATFPFGPATAFTLNPGTMTIVKAADSQSGNITRGASDQSLAKFTFTAYGEAIKVETLRVGFITTGGTATDNRFRNTRILVNGAQVGSNTSVPAAASFAADAGTSFTTNFIVTPGTPATVEIRADVYDDLSTNDISAGTTTAVQAVLVQTTDNGVPQVSITAVDVPSANKNGNNLTITAGTMAVTKSSSYANQTTAVPQTAYKIGSYQLTGNSTEAVNLNTIYVGWGGSSTLNTPSTKLSDLYVVYGGTMTPIKGSVSGASVGALTNSNSWSINKTLGVNEVIPIDVYATLGSDIGTTVTQTTLAVAGTTASSGVATYADLADATSLSAGVSGQTITGATGSLAVSKDTANTAAAQIVDDSGTVKSLTAKIVATTDAYTVTDVTATITGTSSAVSTVSTMTLKNHDTGEVIGSAKPADTSVTWSGLNIPVAAGATLRMDVELALAPVGVGAGTSGDVLTTTITTISARNSAGTTCVTGASATTGCAATTAAGNAIYVYKAIPTLSVVTMPVGVGTLSVGTGVSLFKFKVDTAGTGTIAWNRIMFTIAKTTTPVLSAFKVYNADTGIEVAGSADIRDTANATTCAAGVLGCMVRFVPTAEEQVSGARNYVLKATVASVDATTDSVTTNIANPGATIGFVVPDDYTAVAASGSFASTYAGYGTTPSFAWSDISSGASHDATSTSVLDWNNDYLVRLLPLDSQTLHY